MLPLAEQFRPQNHLELVGQQHLLGEGQPLYNILHQLQPLQSMILWGPPGCGKTSIVNLISQWKHIDFHKLSATSSGVKDVQKVLNESGGLFAGLQKVLFIDEIHRFNKTQQDSLLEAVETGKIIFIGATTEKPQLQINRALVSRCRVFNLKRLENNALQHIIDRLLQHTPIDIQTEATARLIQLADGDARRLINLWEHLTNHAEANHLNEITLDTLEQVEQTGIALMNDENLKYDVMSAFIKSMRGSDVQATVYYLARLLSMGTDAAYIARRIVILASEDIGLANNNALLLAQTALDSVEKIGMPEARIILSQVAIYCAQSPKSNAAYTAINAAMQEVQRSQNLAVPFHLLNTKGYTHKDHNEQKDYIYPHDQPQRAQCQSYLPKEIKDKKFFRG